jgi:hypothetical protein
MLQQLFAHVTHLVTPSFDPFDVVDVVRGVCCSFSTTSSICLLNSTNFGSRSSRGLPNINVERQDTLIVDISR